MGHRRARFGELAFWPRVGAGARGVLTAFAPFVALIALLLLLGGPEQRTRSGLLRVDLLLAVYPLGAAAAGAVVGALWPLTRSRAGAMLAGVVAMLPWAIGIGLTINRGYADWTRGHTVGAAGMALLGAGLGWGMAAGAGRRREWRQRKQRVTSRVHPPAA